jgi:mono/diheme cytochrome c family protein
MKPRYAIYAIGSLLVALGAARAATAPGPATSTVMYPTPPRVVRGQLVFTQHCAMCHGDAGKGDGEMAPMLMHRAGVRPANLSDAARLARLGDAGVRHVVTNGGAHTGRSNLMPAWAGKLSSEQIDDVTAFVMSLPNSPEQDVAQARAEYQATSAGVPGRGATLFQHHCAACHGPQGHGDGTLAPALYARHNIRPRNLTDAAYMSQRTDRELFTTIKLGGGHVGKSPYMPNWGGYLTSAEVKDLVSYIRVISHTEARP